MTEEVLFEALVDRFEGYELVELLDISIEDIIDSFRGKIEENLEFLEEYLHHGR